MSNLFQLRKDVNWVFIQVLIFLTKLMKLIMHLKNCGNKLIKLASENWDYFAGKTLNGETQFVNAIEEDLHITLEDDESLKDFDDNVNSAFCSCVAPVTYGYPVYSALPWYPNYQFYTGFYPNYFQNRLVGPQRFAYSFWH